METPRLTIRVPQPLIAATKQLALTSGLTNSDIVRDALLTHLADHLTADASPTVTA
jgi:predicted DNA binding CopG/RHH family protein